MAWASPAIRQRSTTDATALSGKTFDFVIVGGGTAGLALAGRLSEWNNITVAVIEAGSDGTEFADQIAVPGPSLFYRHYTSIIYFLIRHVVPQRSDGEHLRLGVQNYSAGECR
jgi:choline dehydrogenase-like flavoprotein